MSTSAPNPDPAVAKIVRDPITGLPVLNAGSGAPVLSSKEVREILEDFQ